MFTRRSAGRLLVGLTSAAVLAGCAGGTTASERPSASASPSATPAAVVPTPAVPTASVAGTTPPASVIPALAWQIGSIPPILKDQAPAPAAVGGGDHGFAVVGGRVFRDTEAPSGGMASAWQSGDGLAWEPATADQGLAVGETIPIDDYPDPGLTDVAWGPAGFVAVGLTNPPDPRGGSARYSSDGKTWTRTELADAARSWPAAVTWNGSTYVIVGVARAEGTPRAAAWLSTDGRSWRRVPDGDAFDIGGYVTYPSAYNSGGPVDVVTTAEGSLVAVGRTCTATSTMEEQTTCRPLVLQSVDGEAWTRTLVPDDAGTVLTSVAATPGRIVALANGAGETGDRARLLVSDDAGWRLVEPAGVPALTRISAFGDRFLAVSTIGNRIGLWASMDGEAWAEVPGIPQPTIAPGWESQMQAFSDEDIAVAGNRVVVVGRNQADPVGTTAFSIVGTPSATSSRAS